MIILFWNKLSEKVNPYQVGVAMVSLLAGIALIRISLLGTGYLWQCFWFLALSIALYLVSTGHLFSSQMLVKTETALKHEMENGALWKSRFETLQQQLQREKEKISSLEQDMILLEEKHEERIEALKQLIELTSSESTRDRYRLEHICRQREELEQQKQVLTLENEALKEEVKDRKKPLFTEEEALMRLEMLNEARLDNYQLRILIAEQQKGRKIQEKVKLERAPRAATASKQEKITLQDLARVISKNIK